MGVEGVTQHVASVHPVAAHAVELAASMRTVPVVAHVYVPQLTAVDVATQQVLESQPEDAHSCWSALSMRRVPVPQAVNVEHSAEE